VLHNSICRGSTNDYGDDEDDDDDDDDDEDEDDNEQI
jgi:hypothetical protein